MHVPPDREAEPYFLQSHFFEFKVHKRCIGAVDMVEGDVGNANHVKIDILQFATDESDIVPVAAPKPQFCLLRIL